MDQQLSEGGLSAVTLGTRQKKVSQTGSLGIGIVTSTAKFLGIEDDKKKCIRIRVSDATQREANCRLTERKSSKKKHKILLRQFNNKFMRNTQKGDRTTAYVLKTCRLPVLLSL